MNLDNFPFCSPLHVTIFLFSQRHPHNNSQSIRMSKAEREKNVDFIFLLQNKLLRPHQTQ